MLLRNKTVFTLTIRKQTADGGSYMLRAGKAADVDDRSARVWLGSPLGRHLVREGLVLTAPEGAPEPAPEPEPATAPIPLSDLPWDEAVALVRSMDDPEELEKIHDAEHRKKVKAAIEARIMELIQ